MAIGGQVSRRGVRCDNEWSMKGNGAVKPSDSTMLKIRDLLGDGVNLLIMQSGDYLQVVCVACGHQASWKDTGLDPAVATIRLNCDGCGDLKQWKIPFYPSF